jgi:hydrogenase maturation protein HypF
MPALTRIRIAIRGAVQGVGFRPFVYRLAAELHLTGWVSNSTEGVMIEAEGPKDAIDEFLLRVGREHPRHASIHGLESCFLDCVGFTTFEIRHSSNEGAKRTLIVPDIATCSDCLHDIFDPWNRRYLYPFTNCTNCGPRFTIIEGLPYDRENTTMNRFAMCVRCQAEYEDPLDRRFHAQPNACADCGPQLTLWDPAGRTIACREEAMLRVVEALKRGLIVAVKGLGGFHLMVDAANEDAVVRLRQRKHRVEKPFALMAQSIEGIRELCAVNALEERALLGPEAPIVIMPRAGCSGVAPAIAPNNPYVGVMLPYTPLHHILMRELQRPTVATSGNLSDEPIAIDEYEAIRRLNGIADVFLIHNRPIRRHADDSIVRVILGREQVLRRARGYAPLPFHIPQSIPSTLAVGGHLKNAVALASGDHIFTSQHIGDLQTKEAYDAFRSVIDDFEGLYECRPQVVVSDLHPDYASTSYANRLAETRGIRVERIQHHFAHVMSCMTENGVEPPALGVAWDGTGYGLDETIWGGEFLLAGSSGFHRVAHFRTFPLPGGDAAVRKPNHTAAGLLYEVFGARSFTEDEPPLLRQMLEQNIRCPRTSSMGRLFDAVASLIGLRDEVSFEGQAAMELEFIAAPGIHDKYQYAIAALEPMIVDWEPMIRQILIDHRKRTGVSQIAAKFHNTLAAIAVDVAKRIQEPRVLLTGGCFQNRYLTERTVRCLREAGFSVYWHQRVPPNDGGLALGQVVAAQQTIKQEVTVAAACEVVNELNPKLGAIFPSSVRRGGRDTKKMPRSHL